MPASSLPGVRQPKTFNRLAWYRFRDNRRALLVEHLGHPPSRVETLIIETAVGLEWKIRQADARAADPETPREEVRDLLKMSLAMARELRMTLQSLGLRPASAADPSDKEISAMFVRQQSEGAAL